MDRFWVIERERTERVPRTDLLKCSSCAQTKSKDNFYKANNTSRGYGYRCKACQAHDNFHNEERRLAICGYRQKWAEVNQDHIRELQNMRRKGIKQATPDWSDRDAIKGVFKEASTMVDEDGFIYHCDHITPLNGRHIKDLGCRQVKGLNVPYNIRPIPRTKNSQKSNKLFPQHALHVTSEMYPGKHIVNINSPDGDVDMVAVYEDGILVYTYEA